jgi:hypothetical protein
MRVLSIMIVALFAAPAAAQNLYQPPEVESGSGRPFQLGLFGFSARAGVDFEGQGQAIAGVALDLGDLYTDRLRLRPSAELGFGWGDNTYVANIEVVYRFTADSVVAVPYVGGGAALSGQEGCASVDDCPRVWAQFVLGFELRLRNQINWLLEYHAEDAFRRHRLFIGLTTRRGM